MEIRDFKAEDSPTCLEIFKSNTPRFFGLNELSEFTTFLSNPNSEFLVVLVDGVVQACGGHYRNGSEGWLCWGMVHRDLHGKGIGKKLLIERTRRLFSDPTVTTVSIHTSQHARPFFERFGFASVGASIPDGFAEGIDAITMSLTRGEFQNRRLLKAPSAR